MSRVVVQAVCEGLYQHEFYLSKDETIEKNPALSKYNKEQENPKPNKRKKRVTSQSNTFIKEYIPYEYVLPSSKIINNYKQSPATMTERDAAMDLYNIKITSK